MVCLNRFVPSLLVRGTLVRSNPRAWARQPPFRLDSGIDGGASMASTNEPTAAQCFARSKDAPGYGAAQRPACWGSSRSGTVYPLALIRDTLEPQQARQPSGVTLAGGGAKAFLSNRDTAGNGVEARMASVCATLQ
jgi:hypothetical protein